MFRRVHKPLLFLALLWAVAPASTQAQVINCPSGFASTGDCGVGFVGGSPEAFLATDFPAFNGPALELIQANANHNAASLIYQTQLNIQAFTASFTFTTSGWAVAFVVQNSNNNPASNGHNFTAGAGCEADFFQGASAGGQTTPPNNVFALDFDSYSPLVNGQPFSYSSVQIYQSNGSTTPAPYVQCPCEPSIEGCGTNNSQSPINKISTSPVPLNSPANVMNTATGDTYSATVTYDGSNFTLNLYDVTAGGSCPGSRCFTHTWTNVNIPASVGGPTAWVGIGASTGSNPILDVPLYIHSFVYTEGTPTSTPTPTNTPTPTSTPTPKPTLTPTVTPTVTPTKISTPAPTATSTPSGTAACSPVYTAPVDGSTISGSVPVSMTPNCNAAATACGYFFRNYLPDGTTSDTLGPSWTLNTTQYANGSSGLGVLIYNIGCGTFPGQTVFGLGNDSFTIAN